MPWTHWSSPPKKFARALTLLEARSIVITFFNPDGDVAGISCVPQRYQCGHCNIWLNMQDDLDDHIDRCLKQQEKMERNRRLLAIS